LGCGQRLHQAALAARGVILVDHAFFSGLIQAADGFDHSGLIGLASFDPGASFADGGAGRATEGAVAQAFLFVLAIALNLRFNVSQGLSSKNDSYTAGLNSTRGLRICPVKIVKKLPLRLIEAAVFSSTFE
jgi:hypothetical protein